MAHPNAAMPLLERFWSKVICDVATGCALWTSSTRAGYGSFWLNGRQHLAHRLAWELEIGPIPAGLTLDHLRDRCSSTLCVRTDHLEPCPRGENARRGGNRQKVRCPKGHPYDEANTYVDKRGFRYCRSCQRARMRALAVSRRGH